MFKSFIPDRASIVRNIISYGIAHMFWAGLGIFVWFAPQKWIAFVIEGLPEFFTPHRARVLLIGAAVIVFLMTLRPRPQQKHQSPSWLFRWPRKSKFTDIQESTPLNTIPLVELLKEAETQGWQFTADESQHIFHFTSALRDAGSTGEIQFWGREVQHIQDHTRHKTLTEIGSDMWKGALIRPLSCLENSSDGTTRIVSDNFRTAVEREALQGDLRKDIHLNRKQALSWLQHQVPQSLEDQSKERVPLGDAMVKAYNETKNTKTAEFAEGNDEGIEDFYVVTLLHTKIPVYGRTPSSSIKIQIPDKHLKNLDFTEDVNNPGPFNGHRYCDLEIKRSHLSVFIQIIKDEYEGDLLGNR